MRKTGYVIACICAFALLAPLGCKKKSGKDSEKGDMTASEREKSAGEPMEQPGAMKPTGESMEQPGAMKPTGGPTVKRPARGTDLCSVVCGKAIDMEIAFGLRPDAEKMKEYVKKELECRKRCKGHLKIGGVQKELVDRLHKDCGKIAKAIEYMKCRSRLREEWKKKHTMGNDFPEFCYDGSCPCSRWVGCLDK